MKTKELATEKSAEALIHDSGIDGPIVLHGYDYQTHSATLIVERDYPNSSRFCTVHADTVLQYEIEARAELVLRALRSFEAMREALKDALSAENDRRAGCSMTARDYADLHRSLTDALALADGKAVQS